jgi:predicted dehydrogenase
MEQLRIGVIGCGAGIFHLEGYAEEPRAKVVALAGLDTPRCETLAAKFGVPEIYSDYRDLLEKAEVDAVSVVVPNYLHLPVTLAALEAGKHVLVEKPLARNAAEGEQMVRAAKNAGKILAIAFNRRHRADMEALHKQIELGGLGDIYYAKAFWMRRSGIPGLGSWFTSKELAGGGPLIDLGVHVLDMALWLMGNPKVVTVSAATYSKIGPQGKGNWGGSRFDVSTEHPYEVEDLATAFLRMANGATLHLETSWAAYAGVTDEFGVTLMGDKGGGEIHIKDYANIGTLKFYSDLDGMPIDSTPRLTPKHGHAQIIHRFVDSIVNGTPVSPSGEEGLDRVRLIDAIYRSAERGHEVSLED